MSSWLATKAKRVLAALERLGWLDLTRCSREGWPDYEFSFRDGDELGRKDSSAYREHTGIAGIFSAGSR